MERRSRCSSGRHRRRLTCWSRSRIATASRFINRWPTWWTPRCEARCRCPRSAFARESKLRTVLAPLRERYHAILIDSPPSLGLLTVNALVAADAVVVPIQCEYYALEGLGQLVRTLELVRDGLNPTLSIAGVVLTMYDARTRLAEQVVAEVRRHFGEDVFRTVIPRSVRLSEAPGFGKPITRYDPTTRGAQAYRDLAKEFIDRWNAKRAPAGQNQDRARDAGKE